MGISAIRLDSQLQIPWNEDESDLTVTSVRDTGNVAATVPADSWSKYTGTYREARPSSGVFTSADYKITFSSLTFTDFAIKVRDTVSWDGLDNPAVVVAVGTNALLQYYDLTVRDLVLAYDLRSSGDVLRPADAPTADGLRSVTFDAVYASVPCRLQPDGWQEEPDSDGRLLRRQRYTCYLGTVVNAFAGDVLVVDSVRYDVVGSSVVSAFDTLTTLTVQRFDPVTSG